jgi:hypothetical protein
VKEEWFSRVHVQVEDYLHGIVSVVNELVSFLRQTSLLLLWLNVPKSRLAVNSVTMGDFEEPFKIHTFVSDVFAGFSMVRFGSLRVSDSYHTKSTSST